MTKRVDYYPDGPGGTHWYANEDGTISQCRHNNTGWCNTFAMTHEINPGKVSRMLRTAYEAGLDDGKEQVRRALGVSGK